MPIIHPRETWFVTNTGLISNDVTNTRLDLYINGVPLLSIGESLDLLVYVTPEIVASSDTYRNLFKQGAFTTEGYLHTHDDKSSITHTHTGLDILTGGTLSSADNLHTHNGLITVSEVNGLINSALNEEIDFSFYVRKDGSINQLSDITSNGGAIENAVSKAHDQNHTLLEHSDEFPITITNLIKLMDGSNADCCHTHSFQVARVYEDLQFPVATGKVTPASGEPDWEAFTTNTKEYAFNVDDYIDLQANESPHWWDEGTVGNLHVHFTIQDAQNDGANRGVRFSVWVAYADTNEVWVEQAVLGAEKLVPTGTAAMTNFYLAVGNATLTNYLIGSQIKVRVKRIAATTSTEYNGKVYVSQVGMHMIRDTIGSANERTK